MRFGFLITARCNASCEHCTVNSGPGETAALATDLVVALMDQAAALWREERFPGEGLQFSISGGEPFVDFPRLVRIVRHGAGLGAWVTCTTNGSWASSDERARAKLASLKEAGLATLGVSSSAFHQRFVKRERVERALALAKEAGLRTALKCAITAGDRGRPGSLEHWARTRAVDKLEVFPVMPYLRDGASLPAESYIREPGLPEGTCPAATITVREDGRAYTCCMPGGFNDFLALGSVHEAPLRQIHDRFYVQGKQQVLRHEGPAHFARAIRAEGLGHLLRQEYESVCDLCAHIGSDARLAGVAETAGRRFGDEQLRRELANQGISTGTQGGQATCRSMSRARC